MNPDHIRWFCIGALAAFAYVAFLQWLASRIGKASDEYEPHVPMTLEQRNALRERLALSLIESTRNVG